MTRPTPTITEHPDGTTTVLTENDSLVTIAWLDGPVDGRDPAFTVEIHKPYPNYDGKLLPAGVSWPSIADRRPATARALAHALEAAADIADRLNIDGANDPDPQPRYAPLEPERKCANCGWRPQHGEDFGYHACDTELRRSAPEPDPERDDDFDTDDAHMTPASILIARAATRGPFRGPANTTDLEISTTSEVTTITRTDLGIHTADFRPRPEGGGWLLRSFYGPEPDDHYASLWANRRTAEKAAIRYSTSL